MAAARTVLPSVQAPPFTPTFRTSPPSEGGLASTGGSPLCRSGSYAFAQRPLIVGQRFGNKAAAGQRRSQSASSLAVAEVRALGGDTPLKGDVELPRSPHDALLLRLKSRAARQEAESSRAFLAAYRSEGAAGPDSEARLDALLASTAQHAEELRRRSEELQLEAADAERKLERTNALAVGRATEAELQVMNAFERSQRRIQEDKREEDLQRQRDDVQASFAKVHRRLQSELIELRDYKVLLREFKRVRLEKLYDTLGRVTSGRQLRTCVREMIRHGAQKILQRLESAELPLEPWMREVLVNCCHVEIRIEEAEERLLSLRRRALRPVRDSVEAMLSQTKRERLESLRARARDAQPQGLRDEAPARHSAQVHIDPEALCGAAVAADGSGSPTPGAGFSPSGSRGVPEKAGQQEVVAEMRAAEADIAALRRLLADMRHNTAAVVCNRIRQAEKAGGREAGREATDWGSKMLALLVSEEFAKTMMKEMQKSAPSAKFTT